MEPLWIIVTFLLAGAGTLAGGLLLRWVDRKITARLQWRKGPPWYQPLADVLKLLGKEDLMPVTARGTGFLLAPVVALAATAVAATLLWWAVIRPDRTFLGDLIVLIYLLAMPAVMTVLGASASGNPHAAVGASREVKLLLSYELPLLLAVLVAVAKGGWTLRLGAIIQAQNGSPVVASVSGVAALLIAVVCAQAKLGQVPFDISEAECEIMSGVYVEYSGPSLAYWLMTRAMLLALMPVLLVALFWGGLHAGEWWGYLSFLGKYLLIVALLVLLRNTNPRLRIDQAMRLFWFALTPLACAALAAAAIGAAEGIAWL